LTTKKLEAETKLSKVESEKKQKGQKNAESNEKYKQLINRNDELESQLLKI